MRADEPALETRRFRWLDRWLEPRWRALLTWVVLAAVAGQMFSYLEADIRELNEILLDSIFSLLPFSLPYTVRSNAFVPSLMFLLYWFQPVALKLAWPRTVIWILSSTCLGTAIVAAYHFGVFPKRLLNALLFGLIGGIPGLAVIGQRNRAWMSLVGGALSVGLIFFFARGLMGNLAYIFAGANLIYGAVMLYGTNPIPRRPAAEQHQD